MRLILSWNPRRATATGHGISFYRKPARGKPETCSADAVPWYEVRYKGRVIETDALRPGQVYIELITDNSEVQKPVESTHRAYLLIEAKLRKNPNWWLRIGRGYSPARGSEAAHYKMLDYWNSKSARDMLEAAAEIEQRFGWGKKSIPVYRMTRAEKRERLKGKPPYHVRAV